MHRKVEGRRVAERRRHRPLARAGLAAVGAVAALNLSVGVASADALNWDNVAQCESSGDWHANTGNGFYGGLQFKESTWREFGGVGSPADASREEQIAVANRVLAVQGPKAWPVCGPALISDIPMWKPFRDVMKVFWAIAPH